MRLGLASSRPLRFKRVTLLATSIAALAAIQCGGAPQKSGTPGSKQAGSPGVKALSRAEQLQDSCYVRQYDKCVEALADPGVLNRAGIYGTLCKGGGDYPELCCRARAEFEGSSIESDRLLHDSLIGVCGILCLHKKRDEFCEPFRGPQGEENHAKTCEQYFPAPTLCDGLSPERLAQIKKTRSERERQERVNAQLRAEDAARRAQVEKRQAVRPSPRQPPPPVATSAGPQRRRTSCQYMFLTGGRNGSSYTKAERHFYDAPDCGGACCSGQSFCCVERGSGKEFCSKSSSGQNTSSEPEAHYCSGAASRRDQPRDDYPPLPVLP